MAIFFFFFWLGLLRYRLPAVRFYLYVQLVSVIDKLNLPPPLSCPQPWQPSVSSVEHHPDAYRMLPFVSSCIRHNACVTQQWDRQSWLANANSLLSQTTKQDKRQANSDLGHLVVTVV